MDYCMNSNMDNNIIYLNIYGLQCEMFNKDYNVILQYIIL